MNQRIKELWDQSKTSGVHPEFGEYDKYSASKFAELIVQECIDKIETYKIPIGNSPAGYLASEWTYNALQNIRDDIKETFGVK